METRNLDIVIPFKVNGNSDELRYCLRAIEKHVPHRKIWLVGQKPAWVTGVGFIEVPFDPNVTKYRRINDNLWAAINHPGVSNDFIRWDDDMFPLANVKRIIHAHKGLLKTLGRPDIYGQSIDETIAALKTIGIESPVNYELHTPMIFNKSLLKQVWDDSKVLQYRSYYGNCLSVGGWPAEDNKVYRLDVSADLLDAGFISTSNGSFASGVVGQQLREWFTDPSKYEADNG